MRAANKSAGGIVALDGRLVGSIASFAIEGDTDVTYWIDR
jgi:hypothetical protein